MYNTEIDYTVTSTDEQHYNRIDVCLQPPPTRTSKMIVTSLTTNCNIITLSTDDYITINKHKYCFTADYTDLNSQSFRILLNKVISDSGVETSVDEAGRFVFKSSLMFKINNCSYNVLLMTGLYSTAFPLRSETKIYESTSENESKTTSYTYTAKSTGYYLLTPILYLVSNLGNQSYRPIGRTSLTEKSEYNSMSSSKIVLRINNSFSANYPIVVNNGEFATVICSNDLSHLEFTLVDANMREVNLLNPIYVTIKVAPIADEFLWPLDTELIIRSQY